MNERKTKKGKLNYYYKEINRKLRNTKQKKAQNIVGLKHTKKRNKKM